MAVYGSDRIIAYDPTFEQQTAVGAALVQGKLTAAVRATQIRPWELVATFTDVLDCQNQKMQSQRVTSRYIRSTWEILGRPQVIAGWWAFALGAAAAPTGTTTLTHQLTMMGAAVRAVPVTTLRFGHIGQTGYIVKDCAVNAVSLASTAGKNSEIVLTVEIVANAAFVAASGTSWPACYSGAASLLSDGAFTLDFGGGATSYLSSLKAIRCDYSNGILTGDSPFTGSSVDVARWLRGRVRAYGMTFSLLGDADASDALWVLLSAANNLGTNVAALWQIGATGDTATVGIPSGYGRTQGSPESDFGEAEETVLQAAVVPRDVDGNSLTPVNMLAIVPAAQQAIGYLVPA